MCNNNSHTNYGLRSNISFPRIQALTTFENDIYNLIRNIEFRIVRNDFQDKLKEDIEACSSKNVFNFADNTTNLCKMSYTDYNRV